MKSLASHCYGSEYNRQGDCHPQKWPSWPSLRIAIPWRLPTKNFALWQLTYTLGTSWTRYMNFPWQNMSYKWFYPAQGNATPMSWEGLKLKLCDYRRQRHIQPHTYTLGTYWRLEMSKEPTEDLIPSALFDLIMVDLPGSTRRFGRLPAQPRFEIWSCHPVKSVGLSY